MRLLGEMTIYTAAVVWKQVLEALNTHAETRVLDLSEVTDVFGARDLTRVRCWSIGGCAPRCVFRRSI